MNPGIFYLYEYRNNEKLRNVGFLKIIPRYQTCEIQINARQIPVRQGDSLKFCVLFEQDSKRYARELGDVSCGNNGVASKVAVSESDYPPGRTLATVNGFFLRSDTGSHYAALEPDIEFDTSTVTMWKDAVADEPKEILEEEIPKEDILTETLAEEIPPETIAEAEAIHMEDTAKDAAEESKPSIDSQAISQENAPVDEGIRKIQRSELSILPRKAWNIANNSFLLHGYHNYNHLLLVEKDGHHWIGVPGTFSPREERAAELFGFPQFTNSYIGYLELGEDEKEDSDNFGHWCRYIR